MSHATPKHGAVLLVEEAARRRERLAAEVAANSRALMTPPAIVRPKARQRARHITGAQR
ncbi:hypothetical protein [Streptomyces sp. NPDC056194]|uniref:hypothetical protein n=1 Tax=unclassified Streptomyces TaxID=2593676 RepID=UPI0035E21E80